MIGAICATVTFHRSDSGPPAGGPLSDLWNVTVAQIAPIIPYLLLVLILIFRPTGLMGTREH